MLGGIGSVPGAMVGGLVLGLAEEYVAGYTSSPYRDAIAFTVLILVLLVRPAGHLRPRHRGEGLVARVRPTARSFLPFVIGAPLLYALQQITPADYTIILVAAGVNIVLAVSLNVVNGFTGQFSLGHAGFMAVGAYTAAKISSP